MEKNRKMTEYILMNKDTEVLPFTIVYDRNNFYSFIADRPLGRLPLGFESMEHWLDNRKASKHNGFLAELMDQCGCRNAEGFIRVTHATSINDTFWVKSAAENVHWKDVSLYTNDFDETISKLAFEGIGLYGIQLSSTSPELTTNGSFRKCFRKENGTIFMYKRGSSGYANAGTEPYCEIIGSSVAEKLCRNSVHYDLVTVSFFERLGQESADTFRRMMVIDALTFNRDRHAGNFGVLFDNDTLEPVKMAPVFDMNMCMLAGFMAQDLENPWSRIRQFSPSFSGVNDFISLGKAFLNSEIRKDLISTGKLTVGIKPDKVMANDMIRRLEKILNLQKDALLSGKYSDESEVFVPGVSIDKL